MSAAVVIILNPKTRPNSAAAGSNVRTIEVDVTENATDAEVLHAALTDLEADQP